MRSTRTCPPYDLLELRSVSIAYTDTSFPLNWYFPAQVKDAGTWSANTTTYPWLWARRFESNNWILVYFIADPNPLRSLIESGAIPGRLEKGEPVLGKLGQAHYQILFSQEHPVVDWRFAFPMVRLPSELDPCRKKIELTK